MPSRPKKHWDMGCEYHYREKLTLDTYHKPVGLAPHHNVENVMLH